MDKDMPAYILCDILDWDFMAYEPKSFDFIWASPPCTEYSIEVWGSKVDSWILINQRGRQINSRTT
ncbi:MAG: hypothetical protein ACKPKO_31055, partial [Candidatus Fonsibacter sp.]